VQARRSVWSNPEIIELTTHFVPAADEVHRLQTGRDAESLLFQEFAEQGHYAGRTKPSDTRQGIYAITPAGEFLASCNSTNARTVKRMMETALKRWAERDRSSVSPTPGLEKVRRWEDQFPEDGLVLRVTSRDLPGQRTPRGWHAYAWNTDFAWFRRQEARDFLPASGKVGTLHKVPDHLVDRIVRFHLIDNVRGQTTPHETGSVQKAELTAEVLKVDGDLVSLRLKGESLVSSRGRWPVGGFRDNRDPDEHELGMEMKLLGSAVYDFRSRRFVAFELVALGTRWGGTQFNSRTRDLERSPIGIALTLSQEERVAPAFIWRYGW
jgi:hypothetical protein